MAKNDESLQEDTIDLKTILRLFLKRKWWFIGTVIVVAVLGILYMFSKPVFYEVKYKFSFEDDLLPDDYLMYSDSQQLYSNESVFIEARDVDLIFETALIFRSLGDMEEIDDYSDYVHSSLIDLDLEGDTSIFSLKVKNTNKELANDIAINLIESLGTQVMNNDIAIFDNTLEMIDEDIKVFKEENNAYENEITAINEEIKGIYIGSEGILEGNEVLALNDIHYDIIEKKGEILLYRERIIDNENEMKELNDLYKLFEVEKNKVHSRVEIIKADPDYDIDDDRAINLMIVILLSLLTGIIAVLAVNYIYKLKRK